MLHLNHGTYEWFPMVQIHLDLSIMIMKQTDKCKLIIYYLPTYFGRLCSHHQGFLQEYKNVPTVPLKVQLQPPGLYLTVLEKREGINPDMMAGVRVEI